MSSAAIVLARDVTVTGAPEARAQHCGGHPRRPVGRFPHLDAHRPRRDSVRTPVQRPKDGPGTGRRGRPSRRGGPTEIVRADPQQHRCRRPVVGGRWLVAGSSAPPSSMRRETRCPATIVISSKKYWRTCGSRGWPPAAAWIVMANGLAAPSRGTSTPMPRPGVPRCSAVSRPGTVVAAAAVTSTAQPAVQAAQQYSPVSSAAVPAGLSTATSKRNPACSPVALNNCPPGMAPCRGNRAGLNRPGIPASRPPGRPPARLHLRRRCRRPQPMAALVRHLHDARGAGQQDHRGIAASGSRR